jgi:hypothetical protein
MTIRLTGDVKIAADLRAGAKNVDTKTRNLVRHYGALLRTRVMAKASGRPGPRTITGDYRRSWQNQFSGGGGSYKSETGTNAPQAKRLEFGFHGMDSLGRNYSQPPYAHARPAFDEIVPQFEQGGQALLGELAK